MPERNKIARWWLIRGAAMFVTAAILVGVGFPVTTILSRQEPGTLLEIAKSANLLALPIAACAIVMTLYGAAKLLPPFRCPICGSDDNDAAETSGFAFRHNRQCNLCDTVWRPRVRAWVGLLSVLTGAGIFAMGLLSLGPSTGGHPASPEMTTGMAILAAIGGPPIVYGLGVLFGKLGALKIISDGKRGSPAGK